MSIGTSLGSGRSTLAVPSKLGNMASARKKVEALLGRPLTEDEFGHLAESWEWTNLIRGDDLDDRVAWQDCVDEVESIPRAAATDDAVTREEARALVEVGSMPAGEVRRLRAEALVGGAGERRTRAPCLATNTPRSCRWQRSTAGGVRGRTCRPSAALRDSPGHMAGMLTRRGGSCSPTRCRCRHGSSVTTVTRLAPLARADRGGHRP